ncbi:TFIIH basal transcription factor complex helicase repD subunit [Diplonema papillatum]|nr:TFIIH basal transcription factor complex helicase repD subunit [Diplonema papillatum]
MEIPLRGLDVHFPYETIYPEQLRFMQELQRLLDQGGHGLIEMPCGTGKTISILSTLVSWKIKNGNDVGKVIYCTRTTNELEKVLVELEKLVKHILRTTDYDECPILAVGLAARKTLCINQEVNRLPSAAAVDAACFSRTAGLNDYEEEMPVKDIEDLEGPRCTYYDTACIDEAPAKPLPKGVYSLEGLMQYGTHKHHCPYWLARWALEIADVVVLSYPYIIDTKVAENITDGFPANSVVVFDEAHNIDNICMESLSFTLTKGTARRAKEEAKNLLKAVRQARLSDSARLEQEYAALLQRQSVAGASTHQQTAEAIPGNMRKAEHFVGLLKRLTDFYIERFNRKTTRIEIQNPPDVLRDIKEQVLVTPKQLSHCYSRFRVLLKTLREAAEGYKELQVVVHLVTTMATYADEGFKVVTEPEEATSSNTFWDSAISLVCCDASIAMRHVFQKYRNVVLTSGTLSPLDMYAKILGFSPRVMKSLTITFVRQCAYPLIVSRGADQQSLDESSEAVLSTSFKTRVSNTNSEVVRNYGSFLLELCQVVPDGVVCFFTSYRYMEEVVSSWESAGILSDLTKEKLVFVETKSISETEAALVNYRKACDVGRGALFMSIARGKVAEGIDFDHHYGRAVVVFGVPYLPPDDQALNARLAWMEENRDIKQNTYRAFDAMRQTSQCLGRVLRNKKDYGLMILADRRYLHAERREMLPTWILEAGLDRPGHLNLSADVAVHMASKWLTAMAQPADLDEEMGRSLLSSADVISFLQSDTGPKSVASNKPSKRRKLEIGTDQSGTPPLS